MSQDLERANEQLQCELEVRDAFLLRISAGLQGCVERLAASGANVDEIRSFVRELSIIAGHEEARTPKRHDVDAAKHVIESVRRWQERTKGVPKIVAETVAAGSVVGSWDPDLLDTILGELISNGCKYGGGRPVTVRIESDDLGSGAVRFIVEDEGRGLGQAEPCGRRFTRGRETSNTPGFGVGVWLTRLLAEAHGGTFRLVRREDAGTRAIVELPRGCP